MSDEQHRAWLEGVTCTGSDESESFFDQLYDRQSERLRVDESSDFWRAVALAASQGRSGAGRLVAVIDVGFDVSVPVIANAHPSSVTSAATVDRYARHGTSVALLIKHVAPDAELLLLDASTVTGSIDRPSVAAAIRRAGSLGADVINISLEFATDLTRREVRADAGVLLADDPDRDDWLRELRVWIDETEPYSGERCNPMCQICDAIDDLPAATLVVAAAGNRSSSACPAANRRTLGLGFERESVTMDLAGSIVVRDLPRGDQSLIVEAAVPQPPGFLGTSFAAPLVAGLSALLDRDADLPALAVLPFALTPVVLHTLRLRRLRFSVEQFRTLLDGYALIAEAIPHAHQHWQNGDAAAGCAACSLFLRDWYMGYSAAVSGSPFVTPESAVAVTARAEQITPTVAEVVSNHAWALRQLAASKDETSDERAAILAEAADAYRRALEIRKDPSFADGLRSLAALGGSGQK